MDVRLPDGTIIKGVPDGMSKADLTAKLQANGYDISKLAAPPAAEAPQPARPAEPEGIPGARQERSFIGNVGQTLGNVAAGAIRGAGSIGATLIRPFETAQENEARRRAMDEVLASFGAQPESTAYAAGKFGGEVAGTAGLGGVLAAPIKYGARFVPGLAPAAAAIESGGMLAKTVPGKVAAGAVTGAAGSELIEPGTAGTGAVVGAAVPFAGPLIGKVAGKLADLRQMPANRAARIARGTLGEDVGQVVNALRNAPPNASVAEITANIQNPAWQALIKDSLERTPEGAKYLNKFATMSDAEAVNALSKLAGGPTAAEARGTTELAKENLGKITGPMRESALARANLGKYVADEAALREANDLAVMAGSGGQIDPARFVSQATGAEKALRSVGIKPLEGTQLAQQISGVSRSPQFAGNDLIEGSVNQIADDIAKWTNSGGVIDANALEAIRKNSVNAAIAKLRPGMDATSQRNAAAGVLSRIKPMIDDAIESAGGKGWRDYLTTHSKGMQKIAEKQLSGEALTLWKRNKDEFVRLVQNESPEAVEKILGPGKYNIAVELAEDTLGTMRSLADKRLAQLAASKQASEGEKALATVVRENTSNFRLPSVLSFWFSAGNKGISELQKRVGTKSMKVLSEAMQSPEGAANLLERLPTAERNRILQLISDPSKWSKSTRAAVTGGAAATTSNMLAPDREVENRFVR